ncbi:hypothetical protein JMN32_05390 [Fulvivirga sp. 29W222]|uniref:Uncharacterized protein n=1 Tax=Fulvivirga marina TaxID=2494733 RepID=A0A937FVJ5_9BACT|nr:hypothetical protein [Fulvivirga marina]MBL6445732.1 hypothetical protein [Fulvivirga marina]
MKELYSIANANQDTSGKLKDFEGSYVSKYKQYMEQVVKIDMTDVKSEWDQIQRFNTLRNVFAHYPDHIVNELEKIEVIKEINNLLYERRDNGTLFYIDNKVILIDFLHTIKRFLRVVCIVQGVTQLNKNRVH